LSPAQAENHTGYLAFPDGHVILKIDLSALDPNLINPDEDSAINLELVNESSSEWNSLGQWAEETGYGDYPQQTIEGINHYGTLAYRGIIPPEAISVYGEQEADEAPFVYKDSSYSGIKRIDDLIDEWKALNPECALNYETDEVLTLDQMQNGSLAFNNCGPISHEFEEFVRQRAPEIEIVSEQDAGFSYGGPSEWGYQDATDGDPDGEHRAALLKVNGETFMVDWTATQYGYEQWPLVQKLVDPNELKWERLSNDWTGPTSDLQYDLFPTCNWCGGFMDYEFLPGQLPKWIRFCTNREPGQFTHDYSNLYPTEILRRQKFNVHIPINTKDPEYFIDYEALPDKWFWGLSDVGDPHEVVAHAILTGRIQELIDRVNEISASDPENDYRLAAIRSAIKLANNQRHDQIFTTDANPESNVR
jgi:hypothetical protein